jgi:hypothetical protein
VDMSISTTCWASPVRAIVLLGLLLGLPLAALAFRRREPTVGRAVAFLVAPLIPLGVGNMASAFDLRFLQISMARAGVQGKGVFWAALAEVQEVRLWGLVPACLLAAYSVRILWSCRNSESNGASLPSVIVSAVLVTNGLSVGVALHPRPNMAPSPTSVALAVAALLVPTVLVVAAPRLWRDPSHSHILLAVVVVAILGLSICGFAAARAHYLGLANGRIAP